MLVVIASFLALTALAGSKLIGAWNVAAAGPEWAQQDSAGDSERSWQAANQIYLTYVYPQLAALNIFQQLDAVKSDYFRVIYYDGQIADFKIVSISPSTAGASFKFKKFAKTVTSPPPDGKTVGYTTGGGRYSQCPQWKETTYDTGYWGWTSDETPGASGALPTVVMTRSWNSTGLVTVRQDLPPDNCK